MSDGRTPAQIEADIVRRRHDLAVTLDEIGVRVHPKTIVGSAQDAVRAGGGPHRRTGVRGGQPRGVGRDGPQLVSEDGAPRMERIVPVAVAVVTLVAIVAGLSSRRKRK